MMLRLCSKKLAWVDKVAREAKPSKVAADRVVRERRLARPLREIRRRDRREEQQAQMPRNLAEEQHQRLARVSRNRMSRRFGS
jgi:hypothetical protein